MQGGGIGEKPDFLYQEIQDNGKGNNQPSK
jgi:hypothetical protein